MKPRILLLASSLTLVMSTAAAQEKEGEPGGNLGRKVPAVTQALEIGLGGGYAQGTGDIGDFHAPVGDLAGPGGILQLQVGYRAIPHLAFGVYGSYAQFVHGDAMLDTTDVRSVTAGLWADWHFLPAGALDPWVGLSSGWRGLWLVPQNAANSSIQGLEVVRLQVGLDYRITPEVAIGPVLAAGMSLFLTQEGSGMSGYESIQNPTPNYFFFAGLQARFDVLGHQLK